MFLFYNPNAERNLFTATSEIRHRHQPGTIEFFYDFSCVCYFVICLGFGVITRHLFNVDSVFKNSLFYLLPISSIGFRLLTFSFLKCEGDSPVTFLN